MEAARLVNEALHTPPEGAPLAPDGLGLVPKDTPMPGPINPDVSEVPVPRAGRHGAGGRRPDGRLNGPRSSQERAERQAGRQPERPATVAVDEQARAIPLDEEGRPTDRGSIAGLLQNELARRAAQEAEARKAFEVAEAQRQRKQSAQDTGSYTRQADGSARGARRRHGIARRHRGDVAGTVHFYNAKVRDGQMVEGDRVEPRGEPFMAKGENGKDVQMQSVRFVDRPGQPEMPVPVKSLSGKERPANPRFAQDIAATTYAPPRGVGTAEHQPAPREAAQGSRPSARRNTSRRSSSTRGGKQPGPGRDITDLVFDRLPAETTHAGASAQLPRLPAPRDAAPAAAPQQPPKPPPVAETPPPKRKGTAFLQAVKKGGGIDPAFAAEVGGDSAVQLNRRLPGLMRKGGLTEDGLLEWAQQNGYLTRAEIAEADKNRPGGASQLAKDLVRRALKDEDVHTVANAETAYASEEQERANNDQAYHDYRMQSDPEYRAEQERMLGTRAGVRFAASVRGGREPDRRGVAHRRSGGRAPWRSRPMAARSANSSSWMESGGSSMASKVRRMVRRRGGTTQLRAGSRR
jgi:hypothetical protein